MTDDLYARYLDDRTTDAFLIRYSEVADRLIFTTGLTDLTFHLFGFLCELLRDSSELTTLMSELIRLVFRSLDLFSEAGIFSVLALHLPLYFGECVIIVAYELLYFPCEDIKIYDPVGEAIQELCIM